jgi:indole-3-glycerol phosphate synthase
MAARKLERLALQKQARPLQQVVREAQMAVPRADFAAAIRRKDGISLIAELKKASPVKGVLRADFQPAQLARSYEKAGASAISVITEEDYFQGALDHMTAARGACSLPVLRKDFVFDPYQIHESRAMGADAVLLIAAIMERALLEDLVVLATACSLTPLVEVHDEKELERALGCGATVVGINNRNLKTMQVDLSTTVRLIKLVPAGMVTVSESAIASREDMKLLDSLGVDGALVGEAIVAAPDVEQKIRSLLGEPP